MTEQAAKPTSLPATRLEELTGWALSAHSSAYVWRPTDIEQIKDVFDQARQAETTVSLRGAGNSYNDATLNRNAIVMDLSRMNRILDWNIETGTMRVETGATISDVWRHSLPDGWWPAIVPGTMTPTIGGCMAMNIHGKNSWNLGSFGEHILSVDVLTPKGELLTLTPQSDPELYRAITGNLGMLGVIVRATIQLKQVTSGTLLSKQQVAHNLREMFDIYDEECPRADYIVGWIDGFARGKSAGRGLVQRADFDNRSDRASLQPSAQDLPSRVAGIYPRTSIWRLMKLIFNDPGMTLVNFGQFSMGSLRSKMAPQRVPFAQYHFFHDYIPNWRRVGLPNGMRQFQVFAPTDTAFDLFTDLFKRTHHANIVPYLVTFKKHRADKALLQYQVDGYSLSLDYLITNQNRTRLNTLLEEMREQAFAAKARFYMAKDDLLTAQDFRRSVGDEAMDKFLEIKAQLDPEGILSSDMFRRIGQK
jgi:decaprenylphospho-beta-D-ribofuranose 2-oxidase